MNRCLIFFLAIWCINASALDFKGIVVGEVSNPEKVASAIAGKCGRPWQPDSFVCTSFINFDGNRTSVVVIIGPKGIVQRIDLFLEGDREQAYRGMLTRLGKSTSTLHYDIVLDNKVQKWVVESWKLGGNVRASFRWNASYPLKSIIYYNTKEEGDRLDNHR